MLEWAVESTCLKMMVEKAAVVGTSLKYPSRDFLFVISIHILAGDFVDNNVQELY